MKSLDFNHQDYLNAFIKTAQYLAGLTTHEDAWRHVARVMVKLYPAAWCCFAGRASGGAIELHHFAASEGLLRELPISEEVRETVAEVLETGFLVCRPVPSEGPGPVVFLPITLGNQGAAVMLVGHAAAGSISNEVLNVYLAVAGLAGTTIARLSSEIELKKHRAHLEELVAGRTSELKRTLDRLEVEIAGHMKAQEELKKYRDHLEELVEARTVELANANEGLRVYSAKLERINQELREFAFIASHDLQEPLRKIQTFGDRIETKYGACLGEQGRDYLGRMIGSAVRMSALLRSLRAYSHEASAANPFKPVDLGKVAREAISDLELLIEKAGACIDLGDLPTIDADADQMRALFQNLIGNSVKYCRECEKPVVKVRCLMAGETCGIHIEDNGLGFDEVYLDRIFRPFQRLHARDAFEGTGMGLFICRKIAERHAGSITAKSMPGRGSVFIVTLPVKQASDS
ncbi:MAG: ATP-binding protein [Syntrophobacteraceae bacterium]